MTGRIGAFHVLVAEDGSVLGRFNLVFAGGGTAVPGYRVAQHVAGRGVTTATVRELCGLAAARYGLRMDEINRTFYPLTIAMFLSVGQKWLYSPLMTHDHEPAGSDR